jgi:hypothetical protein
MGGAFIVPGIGSALGKRPQGAHMVLERQPHLLQVVRALRTAGRFAGRLDGWQQQGDEDADNRDDDQEFDERERASASSGRWLRCHGLTSLQIDEWMVASLILAVALPGQDQMN